VDIEVQLPRGLKEGYAYRFTVLTEGMASPYTTYVYKNGRLQPL